jgi:hypothetical protein
VKIPYLVHFLFFKVPHNFFHTNRLKGDSPIFVDTKIGTVPRPWEVGGSMKNHPPVVGFGVNFLHHALQQYCKAENKPEVSHSCPTFARR